VLPDEYPGGNLPWRTPKCIEQCADVSWPADRLRRGQHDAARSGASSGTAGTETLTGQTDVPSDGTTTTAAIRDVTSLLGQPVKPRTATTRSAATGTAQ